MSTTDHIEALSSALRFAINGDKVNIPPVTLGLDLQRVAKMTNGELLAAAKEARAAARDEVQAQELRLARRERAALAAQEKAGRPRCTCDWADDDGNPEVGPDPYIAQLDEACPVHGRKAEPEQWRKLDEEIATFSEQGR